MNKEKGEVYMSNDERREDLTITVFDPGDPSVGIFSAQWEITGGISVEDSEDRKEIREAIRFAFTAITENPIVKFSDELEAERKQFALWFDEEYIKGKKEETNNEQETP